MRRAVIAAAVSVVASLLLAAPDGRAEEARKKRWVRITHTNGATFRGAIVSETVEAVTLDLAPGARAQFQRAKIAKIEAISAPVSGRAARPRPTPTTKAARPTPARGSRARPAPSNEATPLPNITPVPTPRTLPSGLSKVPPRHAARAKEILAALKSALESALEKYGKEQRVHFFNPMRMYELLKAAARTGAPEVRRFIADLLSADPARARLLGGPSNLARTYMTCLRHGTDAASDRELLRLYKMMLEIKRVHEALDRGPARDRAVVARLIAPFDSEQCRNSEFALALAKYTLRNWAKLAREKEEDRLNKLLKRAR